jgi:hypothetical protein
VQRSTTRPDRDSRAAGTNGIARALRFGCSRRDVVPDARGGPIAASGPRWLADDNGEGDPKTSSQCVETAFAPMPRGPFQTSDVSDESY